MAISKIILNGITQMDLTQDTVADASHIRNGYVGHLNDGTSATGSYSGGSPSLQAKTNISPSTSSQTIQADSGYDGLSSVQINAMPSGTAGTPTATKGTVSNHQVTVTPSVTNTTGYITGGTKTGTAVTVTASELASGNKEITSNGTDIDVVEYSTVSVNVESEDFIVTLSYNSTTQMWEPDVTFAEIQSAHTSGKNIYIELVFDNHNLNYSVDGRYTSNGYEYIIHEAGNNLNGHYYVNEYYYVFNSNGLNIVDNYIYYDTSDSDVIASKVASGTTFYGSTGYDVGTAPSRSSTDLTASGATVTAPTGFYSSDATKTIASGSATTPATTITANPSISVSSSGLITATASASHNITPTVSAGYVSNGTAGTITVSGSKTQQLTTKGATTYNTSTTDQTITSGTYLTGTQTIKAVTVSGLDASKILSGTTVMVGDANDADRIASVSGTVTFSTITTSSSNPSGGNNGDIWIKTS